jgi:hypothetical protein
LIYGITGHTFGFGKHITKRLVNEGHSVIGISRTTGFDLTKNINNIVCHLKNCNVIINNSSGGNMQAQLLKQIYQTYNNHNKIVINVGSWITQITANRIQDIDRLHYADKHELLTISNMINSKNLPLRSIYLSWGFHNGNPILDRYSELLDVTTVDQAIDELVNSTRK